LVELLLERGAKVTYHDPFHQEFPHTRKYQMDVPYLEITPENLAQQDCVLISTAHTVYDYDAIVANSALVVDTRNATQAVSQGREKIVKA